MYEDEDDEFLYGSTAKRQKLDDGDDNQGEETKEDSDEDYDPELPADALPPKSSSRKEIVDQAKGTESPDEDEEDEDESDIEFVIEAAPGQEVEPPPGKVPYSSMRVAGQQAKGAGTPSKSDDSKPAQAKPSELNLDKVAELDGTPITQVDLDSLEDKPWRKPGTDITDYFNYGFDEFSWTTYCLRQDNLRDEYDPNKLRTQMMQQMQQMQQMQMQMQMPFIGQQQQAQQEFFPQQQGGYMGGNQGYYRY
ncbi:Fip1 motif-domain-containing protein [Lipomyces chichibuensis]|uniref:Fip1 motif-domain-containing protein n=1 Tax=Lipomyces chichibuensis TaxID=1546026 RepID=UPI003343E0B5